MYYKIIRHSILGEKKKMNNGMIATCEVEVIMPRPQNVAISIPTYNQAKEGYILGCEGISLYMSLKGLGYINDYSVDRFMSTMIKMNIFYHTQYGYKMAKGKDQPIYLPDSCDTEFCSA